MASATSRDIAQPYTLRVIMDIYGVPEEDEPLMLDLTQGIFGAGDPEYIGDAEDPLARGQRRDDLRAVLQHDDSRPPRVPS